MYIFPTKALAQDQKRSLKDMMGYMPGLEETMIETFDGDTPMTERNDIREQARIIFTNPDMLHITILPQEERWRSYLKNLKYVVGTYFGKLLHLRILTVTSGRTALLQWSDGLPYVVHYAETTKNMRRCRQSAC